MKRRHRPVSVERDSALYALGIDPAQVRWDHRPALSVRPYVETDGQRIYTPDENDPRYIVPLPDQAAHDERTFGTSKATTVGSDIHTAAKVKRIERDQAAFRQQLLAKAKGEPKPRSKWAPRKLASRPFQRTRPQ